MTPAAAYHTLNPLYSGGFPSARGEQERAPSIKCKRLNKTNSLSSLNPMQTSRSCSSQANQSSTQI